MNTPVNSLTSSEAWYRDYFQQLWDQAKYRAQQLQDAYTKLSVDQNAINTSAAENVARDLAQTESQMMSFYSTINAGLQRQEQQLRTQLANATELWYINQKQLELGRLQDAYVGLASAGNGWVAPPVNSYTANGQIYNNITGTSAPAPGTWGYVLQPVTDVLSTGTNVISSVLEFVNPTPATKAGLCRIVIDEMVTRAVARLPAPIPGGVSFPVDYWGKEVWKEGASAPFKRTAGGVCDIFLPKDTWSNSLKLWGLSFDDSGADYFKLSLSESDFNAILGDRYAAENLVQLVGAGKVASAADVLSAYQPAPVTSDVAPGDFWALTQTKALNTAAQAEAVSQGIDVTSADWRSSLTGDAAYFSGVQQQVESGTLGATGLADTIDGYVDANYSNGSLTLYDAIDQYGGQLIDALAFIKAIQSGDPLPIVSSSLRLATSIDSLDQKIDLVGLNGAANVATSVLSVLSLEAALQRGDTIAAITSGAQAIAFGARAYAALVEGQVGKEALVNVFGADSLIVGLDKALPYLNIVNSIAHGDAVGAAIAAISIEFPPVGIAYAVFNIVSSLFGDDDDPPPEPWGNAWAGWSGYSTVIHSTGGEGGQSTAYSTFDGVLSYLEQLAAYEQSVNPGSAIGIVANRLPSLSYRNYSGFQLTDIDPLTGVQRYPEIKYDLTGRPYNAPAGTDQASQSLSERFIRVALARGAVAPMWEVETAALQTQAGDPKAGLTEEERAGRNGMLAAPVTGPEQTWRPVALDLDGDGVVTTGTTKTVAFDVDDTGYLKNTAWIENGDGFLFLDRNLNGQIDSAKELFSNGTVALGARGLNGMAWVDSNYDGRLTATDPVWGELKVWQDADGDGVQDAGETKSLAALGITAFDYSMARYEHNGILSEMSSPDLVADTEGTRTHIVPEGIIVETSSGHTSLLVTRIDDRTVIEANRDGFTGYEDTEAIVSGADLLANDMLGGFVGSNLTLTGVSNFTHGTGFLDANGFVHFNPTANYYGAASFSYTIQAPTGQTDTGTVDITLQNLNDAPVAYASPGYGNDGTIVVVDVDDPNGPFNFQVIASPQMGSGSVGSSGGYHYTNWYGPSTPGSAPDGSYRYEPLTLQEDGTYRPDPERAYFVDTYSTQSDPFTVRVTDPHGASTTAQVNSYHTGAYYPSLGSGGGGGKKPIAVDLGNDGFAFTDVDDSNIFFDVNGDGFKHRVAWPKAGDGLLAYDADGNGKIEDGSEISFAAYKDGAQTDLEGLSAFDSNGDGILSAADDKWAKFGVWQDANQNGVTDAGEFKSLPELGVDSIALTSDGEFAVVDGQTVHGVATASKTDGSSLDLADVTLRYSNEVLLGNADGSQVLEKSPFSQSGEVLEGTAADDLIIGKTGNNLVYGYDGDDVVMEDGGNDFIDGGAGDDTIYSGADNDVVIGGDGDDLVFAGLGSDLLLGGDGHDALFAEQGNDVVFGGDGNDLISGGSGNDVLSGDAGDDQVYGESGNDALFGRDGDDELAGMDGHDRLDGGAGNDLLDGGVGEDALIGGAGDDVYVVDAAEDTVVEEAGGGNDTVRSYIDYALGDTLENLTLAGNENLSGTGNGADNVLTGNTGANTLSGGAGNDRLDGGAGADALIGGTGDDVYVVDNAGDAVIEVVGSGNDTVRASIDYSLVADVENLTLTGSAAIDGSGNALDNVIVGNNAANVLDGGAGSDAMLGGRGDDTYIVDAAGDVVIENAGEGVDTIRASVDQVLAENVENLVLTGFAGLSGSGNSLDNVIVGNSGRNRIDGGVGADAMAGGAGDDTFVVDNAGDTVIEGEGEGIDTVEAGVSYGLAANVENLTLTGSENLSATGNALDNRIVGNASANLIDGGSGADTMVGGAGDDVYVVDHAGDTVLENAGEGVDTVEAGVSYGLAANVENLTLTGAAAIDGTGNELDNVLVGNDADNAIYGGAGADVLTGNGGNDRLDGGTGADAMTGGMGDDVYIVDSAADSTQEAADEGIDTVRASVNHGLAADIENLMLTGNEDLAGTGNELDNMITGNGGANLIDGGAGVDLMAGGTGDDTYVVDNAEDRVVEEWFGGTDKIVASVSYVLPEHVENLDLVGTADLAGTGNDLDNAIIGNAGSNVLDGAGGADSMAGGMGDDVYRVDNAGDAIVENAGEGVDTVFANVSYGLAANVDNLTLVGDAAIDGSGNDLDNVLVGNDSANVLFGDLGNDTLTANGGHDRLDGGAGADALFGGTGDDVYVVDDVGDEVVEALGEGRDTVESSIDYVLTANVEDLTLTGEADLHGTGNELDNVMTGNAGDNRLDGLAGADTMSGLGGDDVYVVNDAGDLVVEAFAAGLDTVESSIDYALTANVENLLLTGVDDIDGTGNELDNVIVGNDGRNRLDGGSGKDVMAGGAGDDVYIVDDTEDRTVEGWDEGRETVYASASYRLMANVEELTLTGTADIAGTGNELANLMLGNSGANALAGEAGDDRIVGNEGDDTLIGGDGNDNVDGGVGNDTYVYNLGDDLDLLQDAGGVDAVEFGAGISFDTVAIRTTVADGVTTAHVRILNAGGCEMPDQGIDFVLDGSVSPIESFRFADGMVCNFDDLLIRTQYVYGTSKTRTIVTGRHDDIIYAGPAANTVYAGTGHDVVYAGPRGDTVYGQGGDDYLVGNTLNDVLDGGCGIDVLDGGVGNDVLRGGGYNNALLGNLGQDTILGGQHNDFIAGGKQNDTIDAGAGYNVVAFNRGDGRDIVLASTDASNTLSVGNASYADLAFRKTGSDLVLEVGGSDQITFQGWYVDAANRNFAALQMIGGKGQAGFAHEVETFDFVRLAGEFDHARTADASASSWSLMNGLLDAHLASSDGTAIGGDLAYHYGQEGALMGIGLAGAQTVLKDASFGVQAQSVHSFASLETGTIRLVR